MIDCRVLLECQRLDLAIDELDARLKQHHSKIEKLTGEIGKEAELLKNKEALHKKILLRRRKNETEMEEVNQKIKSSDLRMRSAGISPDTYGALQREVESGKEKISLLETQILEDNEKLEVLEKDIEKSTKVLAGRRLQLEESNRKVAEQTKDIRNERELLKTSRNQTSLSLPADLLEIYEDLRRKSKGKVIYDTEKAGCPACGMKLPESFLITIIGLDGAEPCPHCGFLLRWIGILDGIHT